ncbi:hypothetical protein EXIGLDRAFT_819408 [Exidia glandulosa HHB12029]|uniref:Uncharacterized protein n=1 Tax=Exidia glandulosa HHB12029 TaxID=1314781 RepID=A0A165K5M2_EXIGL|nr:hypothetical protein EXIGLDRAFT_819408 [Exidia glandulosa HHB12029]
MVLPESCVKYLTPEEYAGCLYHALRNARCSSTTGREVQNRRIFNTHLDFYVFFLLVSDVLQSAGGVLGIYWLLAGKASCGTMCYTQGVVKTLGDPGTSMFSLAIAIHTYLVIALRWTPPKSFRIPIAVVVASWGYRLIVCVAVIVSEQPGAPVFQPLPYWCWISAPYGGWRIPGFYLWLWACVGASVALYIPLFLYIRYPIAYVVLSVPYTVMRWSSTGLRSDPVGNSPLWFVCVAIHFLEGLVNVVLFILTRPRILGFEGRSSRQRQPIEGASELHFTVQQQGFTVQEAENNSGRMQG